MMNARGKASINGKMERAIVRSACPTLNDATHWALRIFPHVDDSTLRNPARIRFSFAL